MQITEMLLTNPTARPGTKIVPKGLVIHWTANEKKGADAVANRNYFNKP
ncbi:N-acetylmuramoyl-L-alanine amidase, partial [Mesorhizobium sp. M00.F.Ca.ET.186.01.1.1]